MLNLRFWRKKQSLNVTVKSDHMNSIDTFFLTLCFEEKKRRGEKKEWRGGQEDKEGKRREEKIPVNWRLMWFTETIHLPSQRCGFSSWVWRIPWRRKWQLTPVFLSGKSHGQRTLVGYSPWSHKRVGHNLATKQQCSWRLNDYIKKISLSIMQQLMVAINLRTYIYFLTY